jgi:hypothetical protein
MNTFNRIVAVLLWLTLMALCGVAAVAPLETVAQLQRWLDATDTVLRGWQEAKPSNFLIGQIALGVGALLLFGILTGLEIWNGGRRGVRIRTVQGGSAELDTGSIGRRLAWHIDQLAEIVSVVPLVKSKGGSVDIQLEIETAPEVDVPMKTDEVVDATRVIIEQELGLKLGKLDVRVRYAPMDPEWVQ